MKTKSGCAPLFAILPLVAWAASARADYSGVDLFTLNAPPGTDIPSASTLNAISGQQVVGFGRDTGHNQAILWTSSGTPIELKPASSYSDTVGNAAGGSLQVGYGSGAITGVNRDASTGFNINALVWSGSAASVVNIHPTNLGSIVQSGATATDGTHIVGYGMLADNTDHALLWNSATNSAIDLHPNLSGPFGSFFASIAYATDGSHQVGKAFNSGVSHAILWSNTAASAVDLHPSQLTFFAGSTTNSTALALSGSQQAGFGLGSANGNPSSHALIWAGTKASAIDLHPGGSYVSSVAMATNGTQQAGYGTVSVNGNLINHAMMWNGSAASALDLQGLLPSGPGFVDSIAYAINASGDVSGIADDHLGLQHQVLWIAAPHSATASVAGGSNASATAAGRSSVAGDVHVSFPTANPGTFSNTNALQTTQALAAATGTPNFSLPGGNLAQTWDLAYSGSFSGSATVTFHYDSSLLPAGFDESTLRIEHFVGGQWVQLTGAVDTTQDLITVSTPSFSPFALGAVAAVPEPASLSLLAAGLTLLTLKRRRV